MLRTVELNKNGAVKALSGNDELYVADMETSIKSCAPGEWVEFLDSRKKLRYFGYVNPFARHNAPAGRIVKAVGNQEKDPWTILAGLLSRAVGKRSLISDYGSNARMVYGASDGLPGLVVDAFENGVVTQINTAGLETFRDKIKSELERLLGREVFLLDNPAYREAESLPIRERDWCLDVLKIAEGDLRFEMPGDLLQKVGFYYDHRENRRKLSCYLKRLKHKPRLGADLFCYAGAWGITLRRAGVELVDFVDQGDFGEAVSRNCQLNGWEDKASFHRQDVFSFLKEKEREGKRYDVLVSDPPAFCKNPKGAKKAFEGYLKLHRACFRVLADKSFFAACSCTRYVDLETFSRNVASAARSEGVSLTLLDLGTQGFDHPSSGLNDKSNYLKYLLYYVEKL